MHYQLSKSDKKIARACTDKGLDAEFKEGLERFEAIIRDWRAGNFSDNREAYHELYQAIRKKDKAIARRYDNLTGSHWLAVVASILHDGYISKEDIAGFSKEPKMIIARWISVMGNG